MRPSPMLEHFAEELRVARTAAEMSQASLADAVNYSAALIGKIEQCERRPGPDLARRCDAALGTGGLFERIQRRLHRDGFITWFQEWAVIEAEAVALRWYEPLFVPGLLQTEAYARAVLSGSGLLIADELEQQVANRLARQEILTQPKPPLFTAVIDEAVLRRAIGGPELMREQLDHLVRLGTSLPRLRIHVVPFSAGAYAGLNGPFVIATPPSGGDLVYEEGQLHGQIYDRDEDVKAAVQKWESIRGEALTQQQSIELIRQVARTWS